MTSKWFRTTNILMDLYYDFDFDGEVCPPRRFPSSLSVVLQRFVQLQYVDSNAAFVRTSRVLAVCDGYDRILIPSRGASLPLGLIHVRCASRHRRCIFVNYSTRQVASRIPSSLTKWFHYYAVRVRNQVV